MEYLEVLYCKDSELEKYSEQIISDPLCPIQCSLTKYSAPRISPQFLI